MTTRYQACLSSLSPPVFPSGVPNHLSEAMPLVCSKFTFVPVFNALDYAWDGTGSSSVRNSRLETKITHKHHLKGKKIESQSMLVCLTGWLVELRTTHTLWKTILDACHLVGKMLIHWSLAHHDLHSPDLKTRKVFPCFIVLQNQITTLT